MLLTFVAGISGLVLSAVSKIDMKLWIVGIYYLVAIIVCFLYVARN